MAMQSPNLLVFGQSKQLNIETDTHSHMLFLGFLGCLEPEVLPVWNFQQ